MSYSISARMFRCVMSSASLVTALTSHAGAARPAAPSDGAATTAAPAVAPQDTSFGDIVVTANKREESLNKVGLTVTAISGAVLAERKITSLQDVAGIIPGLSFAQTSSNTPILTLRGIGFNEPSLGTYPAVSVYLDQAPLPFPVLASHAGFDLERIEVLKGPQGTLFGENSTGGAINYIAAKPTKAFTAGGDISYGRFNRVEGNAYVSGQLSETLRGRLAISAVTSDPYQISFTRPGDRNGNTRYIAGRAILDWDPASSVHLALSLNAWQDKSQPIAGQLILLSAQLPSGEQPQEFATPLSPQYSRAADWTPGHAPHSDRRFIQPALRADFDLADHLTLTSLTSYSRYRQTQNTDVDGSALAGNDLRQDNGKIDSFNEELRLANGSGLPFRWVLGANYERSTTFEQEMSYYPDNSTNAPAYFFNFQVFQQGHQSIRNYAGFANGEYDLNDKLTVKASARYTDSRDSASICGYDAGDGHIDALFNFLGSLFSSVPFTPITGNQCFSLNAQGFPSGVPYTNTLREHNVSWRAGVDYQAAPTTLIYANVSRGYKAGSFPILPAASVSQFAPVTQEKVTAYELGIKAGLFDRRVQLNAAAFYDDYGAKQVLTKIQDPVFGVLDQLRNIPQSRIYGAETELTIRAAKGLTLAGSATYLNTKIQKYSGINYVGAPQNFAGQPLPFAPRWSYGFNADYKMLMANGGAPFLGVSVNGRSASDTTPGGNSIAVVNSANTRILPGLIYPFRTNSFATIDARLGYDGPDDRWSVTVWGKNVFDKYYWTNVVTASDFTARYAGPPATFGITLGVKLK